MELHGKEFRFCKTCGKHALHNVLAGDNCVAFVCRNCKEDKVKNLVFKTEPVGEMQKELHLECD